MIARLLLALAGLLAMAGCGQQPPEGFDRPPSPALWLVENDAGRVGWLFGTIHALPGGVDWRSATLEDALDQSGVLVVEVGNLANEDDRAAVFRELSLSAGLPPLSQRVSSGNETLGAIMKSEGLTDRDFHHTETWAVALAIAQIGRDGSSSNNGVDRSLIANRAASEILELEGAKAQLRIFDRLPEAEQQDMLEITLADQAAPSRDPLRLARAWYAGDMNAITAEQESGLLADPQLRAALNTDRNAAWTAKITPLIDAGRKPFIAVGAAHMLWQDGLIAMLRARGYRVTRIQ